jgi:hypothetical protein
MAGCHHCGTPVIWLGSVGGTRLPINAVRSQVYLAHDVEQLKSISTEDLRLLKRRGAYIAHSEVCKNLPQK